VVTLEGQTSGWATVTQYGSVSSRVSTIEGLTSGWALATSLTTVSNDVQTRATTTTVTALTTRVTDLETYRAPYTNGTLSVASNAVVAGTISEGGTSLAAKYALASVVITNNGCTINGSYVTNGASLTIAGTGAVSAAECTNIIVALAAPISVTIPACSNAALAGVAASYVPLTAGVTNNGCTINGSPVTNGAAITVAGGTDTTFTNWVAGDTEIVVAGDPRSGSNTLSIGSGIARTTITNGVATTNWVTGFGYGTGDLAKAVGDITYAPISVTVSAASNAAMAGVEASYAPQTRTVTVNGVAGSLSSNVSFTVAAGGTGDLAKAVADITYAPISVTVSAASNAAIAGVTALAYTTYPAVSNIVTSYGYGTGTTSKAYVDNQDAATSNGVVAWVTGLGYGTGDLTKAVADITYYGINNPSNYYPSSNPSNWVSQTITNGVATTNWVTGLGYGTGDLAKAVGDITYAPISVTVSAASNAAVAGVTALGYTTYPAVTSIVNSVTLDDAPADESSYGRQSNAWGKVTSFPEVTNIVTSYGYNTGDLAQAVANLAYAPISVTIPAASNAAMAGVAAAYVPYTGATAALDMGGKSITNAGTASATNLAVYGTATITATDTKECSFIVTNMAAWTTVSMGPFAQTLTLTSLDAICRASTATVYVVSLTNGASLGDAGTTMNSLTCSGSTNCADTSWDSATLTAGHRLKIYLDNAASDYLNGTNDVHVSLRYTKPTL
jgi:type III secretory pathway lipoprotein EscJ